MGRFDTIIEVRKYIPYHDARGRFTSGGAGGGAGLPAVNGKKYEQLIPKGSYINSQEYLTLKQEAGASDKKSKAAYEEYKALKDELNGEATAKPKSEWTTDDEIDALLGNQPMVYTDRGKEIDAKIKAKQKEFTDALSARDDAYEKMQAIKEANHEQQAAEHEYTMPMKSTKTEYEGFKIDHTGTSHGDDLMEKGYLAEMSPKEYLERCAFEIFDNATIESTIRGTEADSVAKYTKMMQEGVKFDTPYLDYVSGEQEGRHRALAAYNLGIEKIPVVVRDSQYSNALTKKPKSKVDTTRYDDITDNIDDWMESNIDDWMLE
jgi:hypothetical protein